jgi:hypothetical protein
LHKELIGESIFLNSEGVTRILGMTLPGADAEPARHKNFGLGLSPMILMCAAYHSTYDRKSHVTARVLIVMKRDPSSGVGVAIVPQEDAGSLAPDQIILAPGFVAAMYAD